MSLIAELKRRNVIRMAGLYLVGAWLLVQVAGTVLPIFHTPDWALQVLVALVVIGFAPMLVFTWVAARLAALPYDGSLDPANVTRLEDYQIPGTLVLLGENQLALDFLEKIAGDIGGNITWVVAHPAVDPIRCEPRFKAVMQRLRLTDPHVTKVCAGKT